MKKRKIVNVMLLGVVLCSFASCNSYYYVPADSEAMNKLMDGKQVKRVSDDGFYTSSENAPRAAQPMQSQKYAGPTKDRQRSKPMPPQRPEPNRTFDRQAPSAPDRIYSNQPSRPQVYETPQAPARKEVANPPVYNNTTPVNRINSRDVATNDVRQYPVHNTPNTTTNPAQVSRSQVAQQNNNYTNDTRDLYNQPAIETETVVVEVAPTQSAGYGPMTTKDLSNYTNNNTVKANETDQNQLYTIFFKNGAKMIASIEKSPNANKIRIRTVDGQLFEANSSDILKKEIYTK